jgi:hypothetical protein
VVSIPRWGSALSLSVTKDDPGRVVMNNLLAIAREPTGAVSQIGVISPDNFFISEAIVPDCIGVVWLAAR